MFYFYSMKYSKSNVYFTLTENFVLNWPHFKFSVATHSSSYYIRQCRSSPRMELPF